MAGARGRLHKSAHSTSSAPPRRSLRRGRSAQEDGLVPDVFQDLLSEAEASKAAGPDEDRKPLKKRKTAGPAKQRHPSPIPEFEPRNHPFLVSISDPQPPSQSQPQSQPTPLPQSQKLDTTEPAGRAGGSRALQTVEDSSESEDSDLEWEDALGRAGDGNEEESEDDTQPEVGDLSITIGSDKGKEKEHSGKSRRRGITSVDKKLRLDVHKMHVLCLLYHIHRRNSWCNDDNVQATLRRLVPPQTLSKLVPNPEHSQYQASKRFIDAMQDLKQLWPNRFSLNALGMHKPRWTEADTEVQAFAEFDELDDPMEKQDFRRVSRSLQGSQDIGAQLFCALLRSIGIEARLVCSLQCLPFTSAAQASTPQKPTSDKTIIRLDPYNRDQASSPVKARPVPTRPKRLSRLERVFGERNPILSSGVAPKQRKRYHLPYPVYWVEAFNSAQQKWIAIDPLATLTVDKPEKIEPPLNYAQNSLVYAVAFEDDGSAKDVTRRYAKAYNAKTRKFRVDLTEGGSKWWNRTLRYFRRSAILDRDQVEDMALAHREASEGIPKNVQDFKNHPVYVLERHLRHNEVIHPMQPVGKVNVGSAMNPKMEPIYRRKNVHVVRSADKWYRLGRDVSGGEQPLKHAKPKKKAASSNIPDMDIDYQQEEIGAALYAEFQTELYIPPPVVGGRVPRNAYGNLDVYVPSMVPGGGIHIRHKLASKAARIVGVDYVEAVTGFSFKGRHGTAVIQGVVVAKEYQEAVEAVIDAMEYATEQAEQMQRSTEALRMWRRFCLGLKVTQRINAIEIDGETGAVVDMQEEIDREDNAIIGQQLAGGFFVDESVQVEPSVVRRQHRRVLSDDDEDMGGGFFVDESNQDGGFIPEDTARVHEPSNYNEQAYEYAGGFMPEGEDLAGGFIPEDSPTGGSQIDPHTKSPPAPAPAPHPKSPNRTDTPTKATHHSPELPGPTQEEEYPISLHDPPITLTKDIDINAMQVDQNPRPQIIKPDVHIEEHRTPDEETPATETIDRNVAEVAESLPSSPSPSETGSLPLEDPDDEDAEPDWLLDAT